MDGHARPPGARGTVLIVDDEPDVLASTAMVVEGMGYRAVTTSDPSEVVGLVEREQPGLILQDLRMPGLSVAGLVAALRLNPSTAEVPLVFCSAHADVAATANRFDAWGHLSKPFRPDELERLLTRVFAEQEPAPPGTTLPKDIYRDARAMFHEQWNLLQAVANYLAVLRDAQGENAARALQGLDEVLLKLEARTDRLQAFVLGRAGAVEPVPADKAEPGRRRGRTLAERPSRASEAR